MTVLVGILCTDGVVVASDSAATFGTGQMQTIGQQSTRKVHNLASSMIYAGTGAVGIAQILVDTLSQHYSSMGTFKNVKRPDEMMGRLSQAILQTVAPFLQTATSVRQLVGSADASLCKSLIAIAVGGEPQLFTFDFNGAPERATPELPFVSMGSGQPIADPFLAFLHRLFWKESRPTIAEGKLVAVWTIDHVCKTNPGGVGGNVQLMVLPKGSNVLELTDAQVAEHREQASGAEAALVNFLRPEVGPEPPIPPMPVAPIQVQGAAGRLNGGGDIAQ